MDKAIFSLVIAAMALTNAGLVGAQEQQAADAPVERAGRVEVDLGGSIFYYQDNTDDVHFYLHGRGLYNVNEYVGVGAELGWTSQDDSFEGFSADLTGVPLFAEAVLHYPNETGFTPYAVGGLGVILWDLDYNFPSVAIDIDNAFATKLGAGVDYFFDDQFGIALEGSYVFSDTDVNVSSGGLTAGGEVETDYWTLGASAKVLF